MMKNILRLVVAIVWFYYLFRIIKKKEGIL